MVQLASQAGGFKGDLSGVESAMKTLTAAKGKDAAAAKAGAAAAANLITASDGYTPDRKAAVGPQERQPQRQAEEVRLGVVERAEGVDRGLCRRTGDFLGSSTCLPPRCRNSCPSCPSCSAGCARPRPVR